MMKRILHIEDDGDTRTLVETLLKKHGYNVVSASTGKEGLDKLGGEKFDLVLLDVMLPDITGWDIFQRMKETFYKSKVVFLSVVPVSDSELNNLKEDGVSDYITKPFDRVDLVRRIRSILENKKTILHIEDDEDTRNLVKTLLETRGYSVVSASTGQEGLDRLKADIDLVLLDVMLPDASGWTIFQRLRERPGNKSLKVAFLSIIPASEEQLMKFQEQGVSDYITKPFNNADFIWKVDKIIGDSLYEI